MARYAADIREKTNTLTRELELVLGKQYIQRDFLHYAEYLTCLPAFLTLNFFFPGKNKALEQETCF